MPISSGALDWPVSYYTKPLPADTLSAGNVDLDLWSRDYAYRNWTWKNGRSKRRKRKKADKESLIEVRRQRRRCCCCIVWWLTTLILTLLAVTLFFVFWTRDRTSELPPLNPDQMDKFPECDGEWRKTVVLNPTLVNSTYPYSCCYCPDKTILADLIRKGNVWPDGYVTNSSCGSNKKCLASSATTATTLPIITLVSLPILIIYADT